ncbi:MAG: tannase/feruloyl esterase family alpha/beta hydrolase [Stellaceae bacterium]
MRRIVNRRGFGIGIVAALSLGAFVLFPPGRAYAANIAPAVKCSGLVGLTIPRSTMKITKAVEVPKAPPNTVEITPPQPTKVAVALPSHCLADGVIDARVGVGGVHYGIGFAIALPDHWNGRFLFQGGGGLDGTIYPPLGATAAGKRPALARGFAVVSTDSGHKGAVFNPSFFADQEATLNFANTSVGKVTEVAKAIIGHYYGRAPQYSYFTGCSTGGREGMLAAERYPEQFNGIVSGDPAMNTGRSNLGLAWFNYQMSRIAPKDAAGNPEPKKAFSPSDRKLVVNAVLKACDAKDGLKDGMIFNHRQCHFDPAVLQCKGAKNDSCLSAKQVHALKAAFAGPRDSAGEQVYPPFPYSAGMDAAWFIPGILASAGNSPVNPKFMTSINVNRMEDRVDTDGGNMLTNTSRWTNLTTFFGRGSKILFYHGWSDPWFSPLDTLGYYQRMAKASGGMTKVRAHSSRIFLVPGMLHCSGGPSLNHFDLLTAVVDWVEKDKAPKSVVATGHAFPGRSRPICAWPNHAQYKGKGNPNDAANFVCQE